MKYYKNIIEVLLENAEKYPDKIIFEDQVRSVTYNTFANEAAQLGMYLYHKTRARNCPVAVYADKSVNSLIMMFGVLFSGNYYCVLDSKSPAERINHILDTLNPVAIVSDQEYCPDEINAGTEYIYYSKEKICETDLEESENIWCSLIDTDPIYALFTSGSTGVPKGTVITHKSVIAYASSVIEAFGIEASNIFGNQTPFYFSMSVLDIYVTILAGASLYIIPKKMFAFPKNLIELLNEKKINTLYWVPSAMDIVVRYKAFDIIKPLYLRLVMFAGETMPVKCVSYWQRKLMGVVYANLFGPTEITDTCTYHILPGIYSLDESIPIGKAFSNCSVFVIAEDGNLVLPDNEGMEGELYVRGIFVGEGYYNSPEITEKAFVQNPINYHYPEKVYKTGDRVCYDSNGDLIYLGRMDNQIKHMGYRIELGEIEKACYAHEGVDVCACVFVDNKIILYVVSNMTDDDMRVWLTSKLPKYMLPQQIIRMKKLPINANGKIDKIKLKKEYSNGRESQ